MTAALFGISSSKLMRDGTEIRALFDSIATKKTNWYQELSDNMVELNWEQFSRGWLHATAGKF